MVKDLERSRRAEFTSTDLESCINSSPSRSIEDDLKESASSRYHKTVANIQLKCREEFYELAQKLCDEANKMLKANPHRKKEILDDANKQFDLLQDTQRQKRDGMIEKESEKFNALLTKISQYCEGKQQFLDCNLIVA